jgi:FkbM family methyltransferase
MNRLSRRPPPPFVAALPGSTSGLRFECDLRNALAREVFFAGTYEPQETALVASLLGPGATFVDVGSHWGYFSLRASDRVGPAGRVVAIEADPRIFAVLERSRDLNPRAPITAIHAAAAGEPGELELDGFDEAQPNWGVSRVVSGSIATRGPRFRVRAARLDDLLDDLGVGVVDLVKMDIEGAEASALRGMRRGLAEGRYRRVLLELHPEALAAQGCDAADLVAALVEAGHRVWTIDHAPAVTRRASYARRVDIGDVLRPLDPSRPLDVWPHLLFTRPDAAPPEAP